MLRVSASASVSVPRARALCLLHTGIYFLLHTGIYFVDMDPNGRGSCDGLQVFESPNKIRGINPNSRFPPPYCLYGGASMLYTYYTTSIGGKGIVGWEILSVGTRVRICTRVYVHTRLYAHFRALSSTNLKLRVCIYSNTKTRVHTRINRMPMVPSDFSDLT